MLVVPFVWLAGDVLTTELFGWEPLGGFGALLIGVIMIWLIDKED